MKAIEKIKACEGCRKRREKLARIAEEAKRRFALAFESIANKGRK